MIRLIVLAVITLLVLLLIVFFGAFAVAWLLDEHERERERQKKGGAK